MPGRSRYRIELSDAERSELEHRAACYSRPHREVQRAKLVLYAADGLDNIEIARRLDLRPDFLEKAGRVLDLYQGRWEGKLLEPGDFVICADAKPSIQARRRIHESAPPSAGRGQLVEHEYEREGAVTYLDAWDVRRGGVIGRSEPKGGIEPFDRLVWQVMNQQPHAVA